MWRCAASPWRANYSCPPTVGSGTPQWQTDRCTPNAIWRRDPPEDRHRESCANQVGSGGRIATSPRHENDLTDSQRRSLPTTQGIGIPPHLSIQRMTLLFGKAFGALGSEQRVRPRLRHALRIARKYATRPTRSRGGSACRRRRCGTSSTSGRSGSGTRNRSRRERFESQKRDVRIGRWDSKHL